MSYKGPIDIILIERAKMSTRCIVCDESIELNDTQSELVPRMCQKCKDAVMFVRQKIMNQKGVLVKDNHGDYHLLTYSRAE